MGPELTVRPGTQHDIATVAHLHREQLSDSFLSTLGAGFLRSLYRRIVLSPTSTLLVAEQGASVVGFVAGTDHTGRLFREFVRRDAVRAGFAAAPYLLRHPRRTLETLRYGGAEATVALPAAELLSLAVAPSARRRGVGSTLIAALTADFTARGVLGVRVTVASDNPAAIGAYRRAGFRPATQIEVHRGRTSDVLVWK